MREVTAPQWAVHGSVSRPVSENEGLPSLALGHTQEMKTSWPEGLETVHPNTGKRLTFE